MRKDILKSLKKIRTQDEQFKQLPVQLKRKIFEYVEPKDYDKIEQEFQELQKQRWIKTAKQYLLQKNPQSYNKKKYQWEWFLQIISYSLFRDHKIQFEIVSNDNNGLSANIIIQKKNNKINLLIYRELFTYHPNPMSMSDEFDRKHCEIEFIQRSKHGVSYPLLHILYILTVKFGLPMSYVGDNNTVEKLVGILSNIYYSLNYHGEQNPEEKRYLTNFLDYPIHFKKIKKTPLKNYQINFINCLSDILRMQPFPRQKYNKIDIEDYFNRYTEPDYDY